MAPDWSGSLIIKKDVLVILLFFPQNDGCLDDHAWRLFHHWYHFPSLGSGLTLMRSAASPRSGVWGQSPTSGVPFLALTLTVRKRLTQMTRNYLNSASGLICLLKQTYLVEESISTVGSYLYREWTVHVTILKISFFLLQVPTNKSPSSSRSCAFRWSLSSFRGLSL